jgi:hypothetical protein
MKVKFLTVRSSLRPITKEYKSHREIVIPKKDDYVSFIEFDEQNNPFNSYKVECVIYNYAMDTIFIYIS